MVQILIVDDEEQFRKVLRENLEFAGYKVLESRSGAEALEINSWHLADLVIVDIDMPGKEGIETIMELKRKYPLVKIIAMSDGSLESPHLEMAKHLGANRALYKPFDTDELLDAVEMLLKK